ncbi:response regulator [Achromobacter deleyi]|uniref:response regulator n=1 Tax=Achromobacter deleyi TaxID=1353891 RepID=UPI001492328A|nr:response regulator [Achromobacter deleyi]QVQ28869.1 response regulator [Achromobacter deleyi]UIP18985.1 response regulator [Achromobacter deleyi]
MTDAETLPGEQKTVLVVEDNETARWLLAEILANEGYDVCEASNADEALRRLMERSDIRAVISDIEMPGSMDGLEMAALIQRRSPEIGMLLTSGRRDPALDTLPPGVKFMLKPWVPDDLIREVETLLATRK